MSNKKRSRKPKVIREMNFIVQARIALLLELLRGEGSGADLAERLSKRTDGGVQLLQGSIYPTLRKFAEEGVIEVKTKEKAADGESPPMMWHVNRLTSHGQQVAKGYRDTLAKLIQA